MVLLDAWDSLGWTLFSIAGFAILLYIGFIVWGYVSGSIDKFVGKKKQGQDSINFVNETVSDHLKILGDGIDRSYSYSCKKLSNLRKKKIEHIIIDQRDIIFKLKALGELLNQKVITKEEFENIKKSLIESNTKPEKGLSHEYIDLSEFL